MRCMKFMVVLLAMLFLTSLTAHAVTIGVNFTEGSSSNARAEENLAPGDVAGYGIYAAAGWMNMWLENGGVAQSLTDDTGADTGATITYGATNTWGDWFAGTSTPDAKLARGTFDDGTTSPGVGVHIEVANLPYPSYTVVLYLSSDNHNNGAYNGWHFGTWTVNGVQQTGGQITGWTKWTLGQNVLVFKGVTGSTLNIKGPNKNGSNRGSIAGFQIYFNSGAYNPDPADGAVEVPTDKVLSWHSALDPANYSQVNPNLTDHLVYMSTATDPNLYLVATITATGDTGQYSPAGGLALDGTYYWRVDERLGNDANVITGEVWSFKTKLSVPVIDAAYPQDVLAAPGSDVEFKVVAKNPFTDDVSGLSYQWYKYVDGTNDTALSDGAEYTGTTTDTLTVLGVDSADEGGYYCVVTIASSGASSTSAQGTLTLQKLVGHWELNGDLTDQVAGNDGTWSDTNDPNATGVYVAGIDGQALKFAGDGSIATIPNPESFNFYPRAYTVSAWIKTNQTGWGAYVSKQAASPTRGFILTHNNASAVSTLRQGYGDLYGTGVTINDDQWHLVTGTYDNSTGEAKIYIDGRLRNQRVNTTVVDTSDAAVIFGAEWPNGGVPYEGLLDDVRIYNYALAPNAVAELYYSVTGIPVCVQNPPHDLNNDCVIDLQDFALFAADWLECNLVPESLCP